MSFDKTNVSRSSVVFSVMSVENKVSKTTFLSPASSRVFLGPTSKGASYAFSQRQGTKGDQSLNHYRLGELLFCACTNVVEINWRKGPVVCQTRAGDHDTLSPLSIPLCIALQQLSSHKKKKKCIVHVCRQFTMHLHIFESVQNCERNRKPVGQTETGSSY